MTGQDPGGRWWQALRRKADAAGLCPVGPRAPGDGTCAVCRGPVRPGCIRCYQCERHRLRSGSLLADAVVPVSWAVKGTPFGAALWRYKSRRAPDPAAERSLLAVLLAFLHDHGPCVWRQAGMPGPGCLAVVPSGCGRPGPHPLLRLLGPFLRLPPVPLAVRPGDWGRDLAAERFYAERPVPGAPVLLVDDTWVSGASAQSAAVALKRAGARRVAVVVLGRHVDPRDPAALPLAARLGPDRYDPARCAVHGRNVSS